MLSFRGWISLTSALTLLIKSLTLARISLSASIVSYIWSRISLLFSSSWVSTVDCSFASESILFTNVSIGLSKAVAHVIAHMITVAAAVMAK